MESEQTFLHTTLTAMVVGSTVGAGIFLLPVRFQAATGPFGVILAWLIAGGGMLMPAFVFQSLAVRKPDLDAGIFACAKAVFDFRAGAGLNKKLLAMTMAAAVALAAGCSQPNRPGPHKSAQPVIRDKRFYLCGTTTVIFSTQDGHARMTVAGESFDLKPAISASGARYTALDDTPTGFWSKSEQALVTVRGRQLPECRTLREPERPFTARGQEPGWMITIDAGTIFLKADYGALQLRMPKTEPEITAEGFLYRSEADGHRLAVAIEPEICADVATGMPHPYRVRYELDGKAHTGCGGDPRSLLTGLEWIVEAIGGEPVLEKSEPTILFLEEGRVAGNASCNRFMGSFQLSGEGLTFGQMAGTMMACEEPLSDQETRFLELLQNTHRFEIGPQGRLLLHTPDGRHISARR